MLIGTLLPSTIAAFLFFGVADHVCFKLRLYDVQDIIYLFDHN
jgi:hypothetical protein